MKKPDEKSFQEMILGLVDELRKAAFFLVTEGHHSVFSYTFEEFHQATKVSADLKKATYQANVAAMMNAIGLMIGDKADRDKFFSSTN